MKTFKWELTKPAHPSLGKEYTMSLLEVWKEDDGAHARFWAILDKTIRGFFNPIVFNKERNGYQTILEDLDMEEAQLQVEKYLLDNGIMEEGDEVIYEEE